MPKILLAVPHLRQRVESDCLPVCVQMVLAHLGRDVPYRRLIRTLHTREFGTPADNILRLERLGLRVTLSEMPVAQIVQSLRSNHPVIAFLNTIDLPYWELDVDHAVVVVGVDENDHNVYVNDPAFDVAPLPVLISTFELAMLRFDNLCATLEAG